MRYRLGHSLVEVLVALTLVAVGALGAAASVTNALRFAHLAREQTERVDDLRVAIEALRDAGCASDSLSLPVLLHPLSQSASTHGAMRVDALVSGRASVTHTRYCP